MASSSVRLDSIARLAARLADLCVFNRLNHLLDMNADVLQGDFPKLQAVYDRVEALPQIEAWMQAHQDDYPRFKARTAA